MTLGSSLFIPLLIQPFYKMLIKKNNIYIYIMSKSAITTEHSNNEYAEQQKQQQQHDENTKAHDARVGNRGMNLAAGRMVKHLMATASKLHEHMQKKPSSVDIGQHTSVQVDAVDKLKKWEKDEAVLRATAASAHNAAKIAGLPAAQTTPGGLFGSDEHFVTLHGSKHKVVIGGRRKRRRTRRRKRRRSRTHTRKRNRKRSRTRKRKRGGYRKKSRKRRRTRRR
jgi:hypothetical protein